MNVPGVGTGKYDNLIEALMKKERAPRDSAAENLKKYEQQDRIWRKISQFSNEVKEKTRSLYSFNNPFVEKKVDSSNEHAINAIASRDAHEQTFKIAIDHIAQADSFLSKEIAKDFQIPKGTYTFAIGEKTVSIHWSGGKYRNFIDAVNKRGKDIFRISEIKTAPHAVSLLFASQLTGEAHKLTFSDDALSFALENDIIKKNDHTAVNLSKTEAVIPAQTTDTISFSNPVRGAQQYILDYTVSVQKHMDDTPAAAELTTQSETNTTNNTPIQETLGSVSYKGVTVTNAPSDAGLSLELLTASQNTQTPVENNNVLSLVSSRGTLIPLPPVTSDKETQSFSIPLSEYGDITGITVHNNNTHKTISLMSVKVYDPKATGEYVPVNPVSQAQDAALTFEGIPVKRPANKIDDLIPGVTLQLEDKTDKTETITIKPDTQIAKDAIIEFVAKYNRLLTEINIVTSNRKEVIDEIEYFTDDERKTAEENLGSLFGDSTLSALKNNLRQIVANVYRKNTDTPIKTLAQIGISTKSDTSTALNEARLRGYLEIDEKKLDEALNTSIEDIRYLFGYDTDNDVLPDDGVAYQVFKQIEPYIQRGGIFSTRTNGLAAQIKTSKDKIARYDKALEKKEKELKLKYGTMDGALRKLQKQSDMINNFSRQNSNSNN